MGYKLTLATVLRPRSDFRDGFSSARMFEQWLKEAVGTGDFDYVKYDLKIKADENDIYYISFILHKDYVEQSDLIGEIKTAIKNEQLSGK